MLLGFSLSFFILKCLSNSFMLLLLVHVSNSHMSFFCGFVHKEVSCSVKWAFLFKVLIFLENEMVVF